LRVEARGFQWNNPQARDAIFWEYNIANISDYDLTEVAFGYWVDNAIGDDGSDELAYFDTDLDMSYSWDINGIGKGGLPTGTMGFAYLESPGVPSDDIDNADVLFVNTCTIRENADDKLYGTLGHLKKWKSLAPNRRLLVGGCAAQKDKELVRERAPWVDVVIGTHNTTDVINLLNQAEDWGPITEIIEETTDIETEIAAVRESSVSAFVTIQIGCNNSCTFCIVPSVRGIEISRRPSDIINEIKSLAHDGVKEITLLGQNVNSYGRDLMINNRRKPYFTELLYKIHDIDGIERIRFTSPHPKDFKIETLKAVADLPKVANQIHIPLQSGSNKILSSMHRGYNQKRFLEKVDLIKSLIPNVSISSDIIVGFPGENEDDFQQTMDVVNYAEFDLIYMFKFSPRPGTVASDYVDQFIEKDVVDDRFMRLKVRQTEVSE